MIPFTHLKSVALQHTVAYLINFAMSEVNFYNSFLILYYQTFLKNVKKIEARFYNIGLIPPLAIY